MDALKRLGFKGQMIVMVILWVVIGAVGYKYFPNLEKQKKDIKSREQRLAALNTEIEKGINLQKKLPELEKELKNLEAQLNELKAIIPPVREDAALVRKFEELAGRSRLHVGSIKPLKLLTKEFYHEYPLQLIVVANYHDLGLFYSRLAQLPRIFNVTTVHIKQQLDTSSSIQADFKAVTFIYREDVPLVSKEPKAGDAKAKKAKAKKEST